MVGAMIDVEAPQVQVLEYLPQVQLGSGGILGAETFKGWLRLDATSAVLYVVHDRADERAPSARSVSERFAALKEALQVSITDMAMLFDVARPSVYAWMQGKQAPRKDKLERLQRLEQAAEQVAALDIPRMITLINRPLHGGQSLLDLLAEDKPVDAALQQIQDIAHAEEAARRQPKGKSVLRTAQEAADTVGLRGSHREV